MVRRGRSRQRSRTRSVAPKRSISTNRRVISTNKRAISKNRPLTSANDHSRASPNQNTDQNNNASSNQPSSLTQRSMSVPLTNPTGVHQRQKTLFTNPNLNDAPVIEMYTDGSCYPNSESGIGVFFGTDHELNLSQPLPPPHDSGLAEIAAVRTGLNALSGWSKYNSENVTVKTDYLGIIQALQNPGSFNGRFANEYRQIYNLAQSFPKGVQFEHVNGHVGIAGNEAADELARRSTSRGRSRSRTVSRSKSRTRSRSRTKSRSRNHSRSKSHTRKDFSSAAVRSNPRSVYVPSAIHTSTEPTALSSNERIGRSEASRFTANSSAVGLGEVKQSTNGPSEHETDGNEADDESEQSNC